MIEFEGQQFYTVFEVAELFSMSDQQVRRRIYRGVFEAITVKSISSHCWKYLITEESVAAARLDNAALPLVRRERERPTQKWGAEPLEGRRHRLPPGSLICL